MKKFLLLSFFSISFISFAQHFNSADYPKGVYETYEDFRMKTPSQTPNLSSPYSTDSTAYRFNNMDDKGKKFKKAFAISDGKNLYIQIVNLIKKFNSEDKGQSYDGGIYYLKAENKGGYLFVKDYFVSNSAAMWGGLIASASARRKKAVIFEEEKESFNLFKNLKDFQTFMEVNYPNVSLDLEKKKGDQKLDEAEIVAQNLEKISS
ncbi:hypothetical protein SAMN05421847_2960 [Halpernia humi]|uniref:Uncharacterized protein n=1 Tax=Halpernia humi TaxID=493375 RepID=A0A1H6BKI7_9FLAO|nr:hypothetical protein [Halpernia humi]SEG61228.1 hypothetical protein SAMN05421847_2960 [Halpernia humi]